MKPKHKSKKFEPQRRGDAEKNSGRFEKNKTQNSELKTHNSESGIQNANLIFGVLPVLEALRANPKRVEKILVADGAREKRLSEIFDLAKQNRVIIQRTARENLSKFAVENANHQGVIAFAASAEYAVADELLDEIKLQGKSARFNSWTAWKTREIWARFCALPNAPELAELSFPNAAPSV